MQKGATYLAKMKLIIELAKVFLINPDMAAKWE